MIAGLVVQIISHKQIGKAGKMLEQSTQTVGQRIKIIGTIEMPGIGLALIF